MHALSCLLPSLCYATWLQSVRLLAALLSLCFALLGCLSAALASWTLLLISFSSNRVVRGSLPVPQWRVSHVHTFSLAHHVQTQWVADIRDQYRDLRWCARFLLSPIVSCPLEALLP